MLENKELQEQYEEEIIEEILEEEDLPAEEKQEPVYFNELPPDTEVIGVRFRSSGKIYYFDPRGVKYPEGCHAVVETARGLEYGAVTQTNHIVSGREIVLPLRCALRVATPEDDAHHKDNIEKAEEAFLVGNKKIAEHGLDMKLIDTEYTFDNSKLLFYFTSDGRVDFRELVKDLASVFRCRIELRQMGIRDEAKVLGGLGTCGRPFCCHAFLPDFVQVSIKMAKEQNLSLNSAKISGACGRLMCCLRYEYDTYLEEGRLTPKVDSLVNTPDGIGVVVEAKPLLGLVKVRPLEDAAVAPKVYAREDLTPIKKGDENYERALEEKQLDKTARAAGTTRAALKAGKDKPEKEEKPQRPQRPAPQRAASYTDQVMPSILSEKAPADSEKEKEVLLEQGTFEEKRNNHRGRRSGRRGGARYRDDKPQGGESLHTEAKPSEGEAKEQRQQRPPRYEKGKAVEGKTEQVKAERGTKPRYEKTTREDGQAKKNDQPQNQIAKNGNPPHDGDQKRRNHHHRPFRHNKKRDGE